MDQAEINAALIQTFNEAWEYWNTCGRRTHESLELLMLQIELIKTRDRQTWLLNHRPRCTCGLKE